LTAAYFPTTLKTRIYFGVKIENEFAMIADNNAVNSRQNKMSWNNKIFNPSELHPVESGAVGSNRDLILA
jgi:hypothetical protein